MSSYKRFSEMVARLITFPLGGKDAHLHILSVCEFRDTVANFK